MSWIDWLIKYKKVLLALGGSLVLLIVIAFVITWGQEWWFNSGIEAEKERIEELQKEGDAVNANIANLQQKKFEIDVAVNSANANLKVLEEEANIARQDTNQAINNANAVNSTDFNNTTLTDAERARCKAYPMSAGCPK